MIRRSSPRWPGAGLARRWRGLLGRAREREDLALDRVVVRAGIGVPRRGHDVLLAIAGAQTDRQASKRTTAIAVSQNHDDGQRDGYGQGHAGRGERQAQVQDAGQGDQPGYPGEYGDWHDDCLLRESPARVRAVEALMHPGRGLTGYGECGQPSLYLLGLRLADVKFSADTADARDLAPGQFFGERLSLGRVQPGSVQVHPGYGGYGRGCGLRYLGAGTGLAQQVRQRGAEPERDHRQARHQHHHRPRRPGRARGGQQVIDDLAEHAERQGADRRPAGERPGPLRRARASATRRARTRRTPRRRPAA